MKAERESTFFGNKHTTAEEITQTTYECKLPCQNKYSTLQITNDCHSFCRKTRYPTSRDGWLQLQW